MKLSIALCFCSIAAPTKKETTGLALKDLQGDWQAVSVEEKGKPWDKDEVQEVVIEITKDTLIYKRNRQTESFRMTITPDKKPAQIDLRLISPGADPDKVCCGIYSLDGNKLKLCLHSEFTAHDPADRPSEFSTGTRKPAQGQLLVVFERKKK